MVSVLDYEASDPCSIPSSGVTIDKLFQCWVVAQPGTVTSSVGLDWIMGEVMARTVGSAGNKWFHPYQVGTFVDYPR